MSAPPEDPRPGADGMSRRPDVSGGTTGGAGAAGGGIISRRAAEPVGPYPHARRVGGLLFLSGLGPRQAGGGPIPGVTLDDQGRIVSYDIEAQCESVFRNVRAVLEDAGSSWDRIVDVTVFLTDMQDFARMNGVYARYFAGPGQPNPTRTTVAVTALPTPIAIELKVIATV
jgi:2-aminomuconate deaminase